MEIEIFKTHEGYGYKVGQVYQEFHPDKEGFISMTYEEAQIKALEVKNRLEQ